MPNFKITIAYEGTRYNGWQIQKSSENTIQGKISAVLSKMVGKTVEVIGSGRTDAGVHAKEQVANFVIDDNFAVNDILLYLNRYLPEDIAVLNIQEVDSKFHARYSCTYKIYSYSIYTSLIPDVFQRKYYYNYTDAVLNVELMRQAAKYFVGEHDFKAFCGNTHFKKSSVRTIFSIDIVSNNNYIVVNIAGNGFLQNMVRIICGTLIEVGNGSILLSKIPEIIESKNRSYAGFTAPPQGLTLVKVGYDTYFNKFFTHLH